jgi:hypothetical protein
MTSIDMAQMPLPPSYGFVSQAQTPMMWFGNQAQGQPTSPSSQELFAQQSQAGLSALSFMGGQGQDMFAASAGAAQASYSANTNGFAAQQTPTPTSYRQGANTLMGGDTLAMWQNAPTGFECVVFFDVFPHLLLLTLVTFADGRIGDHIFQP